MNAPDSPRPAGPRRALLAYLMVTAVVSGALVMVVEVLGSRVIGPFFGVSLFVWTSLITVTLVSLAAGYAIGGWLADRKETAETLYGIILLAGFSVLAVPWLKSGVLKVCFPLGLRLGSLAAALLLFGPSLFLMGCVSPFLVKLATRELRSVGRTVGGFYALSTLGSVLGTVVTGFVLVAYLGVDRVFALVGALLIGLSVIFFLFRRHWLAVAAVILPVLGFVPGSRDEPLVRYLDTGARAELIVAEDTHYGSVRVVDYVYENGVHTRELLIDGLIQGGVDLATNRSIYATPYFLEGLPRAIHPDGETCLVVGLGAGIVPRGYESHGVACDVVDIDPKVVDYARRYFGFTNRGEIAVQDARYFLMRSKKRYDYLVLDVFSGDVTPGYLLSREAVALLRQRVTDRGVLAINLVGSLRREPMMTASVVETLRTSFDQVQIHPNFDVTEEGVGNLTVLAYAGDRREVRVTTLYHMKVHPFASRAFFSQVRRQPFEFPPDVPASVLTDDYNPIDFYDAWLRERVRKGILEGTDWDVLIESS